MLLCVVKYCQIPCAVKYRTGLRSGVTCSTNLRPDPIVDPPHTHIHPSPTSTLPCLTPSVRIYKTYKLHAENNKDLSEKVKKYANSQFIKAKEKVLCVIGSFEMSSEALEN